MMKKTILFVAGSIETVPAVKLAKEMGLHTVVSDGNPKAACFKHADDSIVANTYDVAETVDKAIHYNNTVRRIDGVICVASDVPLTVASVASALGLPGIPVTSAKLASDKLAMKQQFKSDGIPIPWFCQVHSAQMLTELVKQETRRLIIKPVDSRGARGVMRLLDNLDLANAFDIAAKNSPTHRVMVEEYIEGPQVSTETIMLHGTAYTPGFADRNYSLIDKYAPYMIEDGGDLPSRLPQETQKKIRALVARAALSMGISHGVVKGDIVVRDGEPMIIELAARLSGGYFCTHEIPMNTGVDLVGAAIRLALNDPVDSFSLIPKFNRFICQRYLFPNAGVVQSIEGADAVRERAEIELVEIKVAPGDTIGPIENHPARAGLVIASGKNREDALMNAERAVADIKVRVN